MNQVVKNLLKSIDDHGYRSFVVGGYVRDYILGLNDNYDVDIATDAPANLLLDIFSDYSPKVYKFDTIKFKIDKYSVDIAQFRDEKLIDSRLIIKRTQDIETDESRRDFTVNSIYMDKEGNYTDYYGGIDDVKEKRLVFIGDPALRITEDPDRILRMIFFSIKYDFSADLYLNSDMYDLFKSNIKLCSDSSLSKYLLKIFQTNRLKDFFELITKIELDSFFFGNKDNVLFNNLYVFLISTNFKFINLLPNDIIKTIDCINEIVKGSIIDEKTLFNYSYENNINAAIILNVSLEEVKDKFNSMQIHSLNDVLINKKEIAHLINSEIDDNVNKIYNNIIDLLIYNKMINDKKVLTNYVLRGELNEL